MVKFEGHLSATKNLVGYTKYVSLITWTNAFELGVGCCAYCRMNGVAPGRLVFADQVPWVDHVYSKTALDLILDSTVKNGHTTGA